MHCHSYASCPSISHTTSRNALDRAHSATDDAALGFCAAGYYGRRPVLLARKKLS
jgi:hypothetical protein